jgi:mRNA interferase MazF
MQMRRGDVVTVAATGDYGKPRPAVIVQSDAFPENHGSVVVCQLTPELVDAADFRLTIEPTPENGLRLKSQVMADKPVTVRRERIGKKMGRLGNQDMARLGIALAFALGLAD